MKRNASPAALILCGALLLGIPAGSEEEGETGGARVGPGKAVLEASERDGLRLSPEAIRRLGLSFRDVKTTAVQPVPPKSLVHFRDQTGVYRLRNGWFKLIEIRLLAKTPLEARVRSSEIRPGDRIVVDGAAFLRCAEMDVFGPASEPKGADDERGE